MNKIEHALEDAKLQLKVIEREQLILSTRNQIYREHIRTLEIIMEDDRIPHSETEEINGLKDL